MTRTRRLAGLAATFVAAAVAVTMAPGTIASANEGLDDARSGTAGYHNLDKATAAGYGEFRDQDGIACIDKPGVGGMGVHYVKGALVGDPAEIATAPEALVYEPQPNGRLRLVAVEWVVVQSAWEAAGNTEPPSLFGREFELVDENNRYGLPPFYELHAWIWKNNPRGMFDDWNPNVRCGS
jgi:hypothetical protein